MHLQWLRWARRRIGAVWTYGAHALSLLCHVPSFLLRYPGATRLFNQINLFTLHFTAQTTTHRGAEICLMRCVPRCADPNASTPNCPSDDFT